MGRKQHSAEQIIGKLREAEVDDLPPIVAPLTV